MKSVLLSLFVLLVFSGGSFAQSLPVVQVNFQKKEILINGTRFTNTSTLEEYLKVLGKPDRVEKIAGFDRIHAYDQSGIALSVKYNTTIVEEIYLTYTYDGDKKVARQEFKGQLSINEQPVTPQVTEEDLSNKTGITFKSAGFMPMSMTDNPGFNIVTAWTESKEKPLGQLALSFAAGK